MTDSIVNTLGAGSGINISALVNDLVTASFQARNSTLNRQNQTLSAQISAAGTLRSDINSFVEGLKTLATGGTVSAQATSSNTNIVRATAISGARLSGVSTQLEVRQLAQAQATASAPVADRAAAVGTGTLTLQLGVATTADGAITGFTAGTSAAVDITIDSSNSSLEGIAAAINAADAGVTATIISDSAGARLALKGATGEAQAFTLTATEDVGAEGLAALNVGVGSTVGTAAQDAIVAVDGTALKRSTNSISDLVDGVRLDLVAPSVGTTVSLTSSTPTDTLRQVVNDYVSAFNNLQANLRAQTNAVDGPLRGDAAARSFGAALGRLNLTQLSTTTETGAPRTLADVGVSTNRDGTISVRTERLDAALRDFPEAVEALFANGTGASGGGLAAAFQAIADPAVSTSTGLGATIDRYTDQQETIAEALDRVASETEALRARLTRQFSSSDAQVAAYRQTQALLTQVFRPNTDNN
ncbi:MAG: flagellar hook protein [Sphingobium sp.]|nr:flagellar hook protein [Sphingobium sp.]